MKDFTRSRILVSRRPFVVTFARREVYLPGDPLNACDPQKPATASHACISEASRRRWCAYWATQSDCALADRLVLTDRSPLVRLLVCCRSKRAKEAVR